METKTCPDCLSEIPDAAEVCRHCGERVEGQRCSQCGARNWPDAALCRWCRERFEPEGHTLDFEAFEVAARRLPTLLTRGRLLTRTISLSREKILVRTPGPFNLTRKEQEIPWAKVAGFDYHAGLFWDRVRIETRGQSSTSVGCLAKADGERIRELLQQLEV